MVTSASYSHYPSSDAAMLERSVKLSSVLSVAAVACHGSRHNKHRYKIPLQSDVNEQADERSTTESRSTVNEVAGTSASAASLTRNATATRKTERTPDL